MAPDEKLTLKLKLIDVCKQKQMDTIGNLRREMDEHQQMANDYGPPRDRYDAFRSQMLRRRDIFAEQLQKANEELIMLDKINPKETKTKVEFGAIVYTDKQTLFISTSLGKIEVGDQTFFAVSPAVPIFKVLQGLKTGDSVVFNGNKIVITDIF